MKKLIIPSIVSACCVLASTVAFGAITPSYTTFGNLAGATFGGSGIPTDPTAITVIDLGGGNSIKLGLTAFGRYANPPIANNGAGVFTAKTGVNDGLGVPSHALGTTWGFGIYIDVAGGGKIGDYQFDLLYDFDPAAGVDDLGSWDINTAINLAYGAGTTALISNAQDSENLYFAFLSTSSSFVTPPSGSFNPNAIGEYGLALTAKNLSGAEIGRSAILVRTVPDASSTLSLCLFALGGLMVFGYFTRRTIYA